MAASPTGAEEAAGATVVPRAPMLGKEVSSLSVVIVLLDPELGKAEVAVGSIALTTLDLSVVVVNVVEAAILNLSKELGDSREHLVVIELSERSAGSNREEGKAGEFHWDWFKVFWSFNYNTPLDQTYS